MSSLTLWFLKQLNNMLKLWFSADFIANCFIHHFHLYFRIWSQGWQNLKSCTSVMATTTV
jgi:hypothetical protein